MHKGFSGLLTVLLSLVPVLTSVHAQTGSPVIISAFPNATAAADNNQNAPGAPVGKVFKYFMQIWLENADYAKPNYVAASAGTNFGITNDDYYDIPANQTSIFDLLEAKGLTWKSYNEEIPAPGWTGYSAFGGAYVRKHNPAIIFDNIGLNQTRSANVVPATLLTSDIANNNMPAYSFYTPNITNDGHDTSASFAGTWLVNFLDSTLNDAAFMQDALVLITFDENSSTNKRNQVWACLIGGVIPDNLKGTTDDTFYTHYSALNTVELNWGLGSLGRGDANQTLANVFEFAAGALGYQNVAVSPVPLMNTAISGLLTGQSWNETHP
ncbi:phosphoesterase family-domain-containing protein [Amanita rubescens]|nr:phosphoesterase family-domain-containing protein [Amanita rubescens]